MADPFTDLLSDYLDDEELSLEERHRIEKHLAECGECRATLADLREVALQASALVDTPPAVDLWPGVAARIGGVEQAWAPAAAEACDPSDATGCPAVFVHRSAAGRRWSRVDAPVGWYCVARQNGRAADRLPACVSAAG